MMNERVGEKGGRQNDKKWCGCERWYLLKQGRGGERWERWESGREGQVTQQLTRTHSLTLHTERESDRELEGSELNNWAGRYYLYHYLYYR